MKRKIKKIIVNIMSIFKIKNVIVFESNADYSDNSRAFYEYLIREKYNEKYKIYGCVGGSAVCLFRLSGRCGSGRSQSKRRYSFQRSS